MNFKEFDKPREKPQVRPVTTMTSKELGDRIEKARAKNFKKPEPLDFTKLWSKEKPAVEAGVTPGGTKVDYANIMFRGKEIDHNSIEYEMQDFSDMIYELHGAKYIDGTPLTDEELQELERTDEFTDWVSMDYASSGPDAPDDYPFEEDGMTSADVDRIRNQKFTTNQIKQAYRVLNHPRVKGGNYTAAYNIINRIAPGLADHPDVANALRRANEMKEDITTMASRVIRNYAREIGPDSMDYGMFMTSAELLDKGMLKSLAQLIHKSDTAPREYVMKKIADHDPETFKKMYGDQEGYLSLMKPIGMEGFIGKKPDYTDFLQNKLDSAIQEYDSPEKKAERDALMQKYLKKGGKIEKVPTGKTAYKNKELKPAYRKDNGTPITSPMSDESVDEDISEKGRIVLEKAGFDPNAIHEYMAVFNDHGDTSELEDMNRNKIGVADAMAMVLASHDVQNESVQEDAPFGDGMSLVRRALMSKWITAEEWFHLKDEFKRAAEEVEEKYSDWPEGEGFGSSDHNFAIKDLMSAAGYEFDEHDTSGRFVVSKMPEKLEKQGIRNVRMKGEPVKTEADTDIDYRYRGSRLNKEYLAYKEKQKELFTHLVDAYSEDGTGTMDTPRAEKEAMKMLNFDPADVEKYTAFNKEAEQNEGGMPASIIKHKQKLAHMSDEELADRFKDFDEQRLRQMAWRHGYGKMSSHYLDRVRNHMTSKRTGTTEAKQEGFAVRYLDPKNGKRFAVAFKTKVDATKKAAQLKSVGVKDISITQHNLNFKEAKKDLTYESKLADMLNQRLK